MPTYPVKNLKTERKTLTGTKTGLLVVPVPVKWVKCNSKVKQIQVGGMKS
jgi:hypothetical protein